MLLQLSDCRGRNEGHRKGEALAAIKLLEECFPNSAAVLVEDQSWVVVARTVSLDADVPKLNVESKEMRPVSLGAHQNESARMRFIAGMSAGAHSRSSNSAPLNHLMLACS